MKAIRWIICAFAVTALCHCGFRVAIYSGLAADSNSAAGITQLLERRGYRPTALLNGNLRDSALDGIDMLCFPSGIPERFFTVLQGEQYDIIRDYVRAGGGLMLVGGSSFLLAHRVGAIQAASLRRYRAAARSGAGGTGANGVEINLTNKSHPVSRHSPGSYSGTSITADHYFFFDEVPGATFLGSYADTGDTAILAFQYGEGRVFAMAKQPEEAGSGPESELMARAADWILERPRLSYLKRKLRAVARALVELNPQVLSLIGLGLYALVSGIYFYRKSTAS